MPTGREDFPVVWVRLEIYEAENGRVTRILNGTRVADAAIDAFVHGCGREIIPAIQAATPVRTGATRASWRVRRFRSVIVFSVDVPYAYDIRSRGRSLADIAGPIAQAGFDHVWRRYVPPALGLLLERNPSALPLYGEVIGAWRVLQRQWARVFPLG